MTEYSQWVDDGRLSVLHYEGFRDISCIIIFAMKFLRNKMVVASVVLTARRNGLMKLLTIYTEDPE